MTPPVDPEEQKRLEALASTGLMDSPREQAFDNLALLAKRLCRTEIALVSLIDGHRQWFKSAVGFVQREIPRSQSFCAHALGGTTLLVVEDASQDRRFHDNPLVTGEPGIRAYAGAPLVLEPGVVIGTLCVIDLKPRTFTTEELDSLQLLAGQVIDEIRLRTTLRNLQNEAESRRVTEKRVQDQASLLSHALRVGKMGTWHYDGKTGRLSWSEATCELFGIKLADFRGTLEHFLSLVHPDDRTALTEMIHASQDPEVYFEKEYRALLPGGKIRWLYERGNVVVDPESGVVSRLGVVIDVSQQKLAEQSFEAFMRRLRAQSEHVPFLVWTATPDGLVDFANTRLYELTGAPRDKRIGAVWPDYIHPEDRERSLLAWQACVDSGTRYQIEYRVRLVDNSFRWLRVQADPMRDDDGKITFWYGVGIDIHETRRLEEEATRLAKRLSTTLDSITDAFLTLDPAWRITYMNSEAERILKRSKQDILNHVVWDEFPEAVDSIFYTNYHKALAEMQPVFFDTYYPPLDAWLEVRAFPSEEGLALYFRDITEKKRYDVQLAESEERFRTLLQNVSTVAVQGYALDGTVQYWNKASETFYGYSAMEALGKNLLDLIIPEPMHDEVRAAIQMVRDGGREIPSGELRLKRKDGSLIDVYSSHAILFREGKPPELFCIDIDISEREQAARKLKEQAELLEKARDAIIVCDVSQTVLFWNPAAAQIYGWTAAEAIGRPLNSLVDRDSESFAKAYARVFSDGEWSGQLLQYSRTGSKILVDARWTLVRDDRGIPTSILAIHTDITERHKLEQQFLRAQRMESIGTLAGGIAHDLNNLLSPIVIGVDLLRQLDQDESRLSIISDIGRSAERGANLVKQVLSFARGVEGARMPLRIDNLIRELRAIVENTFPKNIRFDYVQATDLWSVVGDPTQINQVLLNLCVNARDAMATGGRLTVKTRNLWLDGKDPALDPSKPSGHFVVIEVADEGTGIPPELIDRIFEPFFTTKEHGKGTGLGLSSVLGIVRSHGGFVTVYSELGKGSSFKVHLPAQVEPAAEEPTAGGIVTLPRGNSELILVVDDEVAILDMTRQTLEAFGYRVLCAEDGAQAIAIFAQNRDSVRLVLTDMMMPIMDGPALIKALRRLAPEVTIVAASGLDANGHVARAAGNDVHHFIPKPYTAEHLLKTIREALDHQG